MTVAESAQVKHPDDLDHALWLIRMFYEANGPMEISFSKIGTKSASVRSVMQNKLAFRWYKYLSETMQDGTPEDKRAFCKLHCAVPIRREDEAFRDVYDRVVRPLPYEAKLEIMVGAIDFPVTRDFSIKEFARYLEAIEITFAEQGIVLPKPEDLYYDALMREKR